MRVGIGRRDLPRGGKSALRETVRGNPDCADFGPPAGGFDSNVPVRKWAL